MSDVAAQAQVDDAPSPPTFDILPLSAETRAALAKMGYQHPTPVQRAVFEPATRGKDLVVQARTGTGKTTAFGLPIVDALVKRSQKAVQVLCLCPTRELSLQVSAEVEKLGEGRNIKPVAIYGGAPMGRQMDALAAGAQVVVGTPGRVLDHIKRGTLDTSQVRVLVLDEADEMLSMGFERELTAILDTLPKERQTLLFSATLPPDIERMARERLRGPEFITLSSDAVGAQSIAHFVYFVHDDKLGSLIKIIETENPESAVLFCNTRAETEVVSGALQRAGFDADWINGDLPQNEREEVMGRIKRGELRFMVATDVAARGIDISNLTHVINYDFPESAEQYVHRTGRTGRAGRTGTAFSLVRPQDIGNLYILRLTYQIKPFERTLPSAGELKTRREADLLQMIAEAFSRGDAHPDDAALARRLLTHDRAERIVAGLLRSFLGDRAIAEESASAARRAKPPRRSDEEAEAKPQPRPSRERGRDRDDRPRDDRPRDDRPRDDRPRDDRPRDDRPRDDRPRDDRPRDDRPRDDRPRDDRPRDDRPRDDRGRGPRDRDRDRDRDRGRDRPRDRRPEGEAPEAAAADKGERGDRGERDVQRDAQPEAPRPVQADAQPEAAPAGDEPTIFVSSGDREPRPEPRRPRGSYRGRNAPSDDELGIRYTVSDAQSGAAAAPQPRPTIERPADLVSWHPPEEEGDDAPILVKPAQAPRAEGAEGDEGEGEGEAGFDADDFVVVFVDVGRRDGARPGDFQRVLRDRGNIGRRDTGRIRVRDKHALVAVRRELLQRAIEAFEGAELGGKQAHAEQARERSSQPE